MSRGSHAAGTTLALLLWAAGSLGAAATTDAEVEAALRRGKVERMESLPIGVTLPQRVWLSHQGSSLSAAFKTVDIEKHGISRLADRSTEVNFSDRYQYDVAAYRVARELGLEIVPTAVERKIRNRKGALVLWIDNTFTESERAAERRIPPDVDGWQRQLSVMRLFDALIANVDRNPGNILYRESDWKVYLIDHTRAFRNETTLIEAFRDRPTRLDRQLLSSLERLQRDPLRKLLKHLVTGRQINHMLARRDLILEKIERERRKFGDDAVLFDD